MLNVVGYMGIAFLFNFGDSLSLRRLIVVRLVYPFQPLPIFFPVFEA